MVKFENYSGPKYNGTNILPIRPETVAFKKASNTFTRKQFPLQLAYAISIHRSQGLTLDQAVVSIGEREFALGMTYVALSRVRTLKKVNDKKGLIDKRRELNSSFENSHDLATSAVALGEMRYLYGASDEKFIKAKRERTGELPSPLNSYKFRLQTITSGKSLDFDKQAVPINFKCSPDTLLNLCAIVVDAFPLPSVYKWTTMDICKWLRNIGYRQYQNTFRENFINGRTFLLLDASALSAMNIKDFDHIKDIAQQIRSLFFFEMTKFGRSITLYPELHLEVFKLLRVKTGLKTERLRRSDLWRNLQLVRQKVPYLSHWELLERWLDVGKDLKCPERVGETHRFSMYRCNENKTSPTTTAKDTHRCMCVPPCECYWTAKELHAPWRLKCLPDLMPDNEFVEKCDCCISPCTCRWTAKKYMTRNVLACLQKSFPQKYGQFYATPWHRTKKLEPMHAYRLSLA